MLGGLLKLVTDWIDTMILLFWSSICWHKNIWGTTHPNSWLAMYVSQHYLHFHLTSLDECQSWHARILSLLVIPYFIKDSCWLPLIIRVIIYLQQGVGVFNLIQGNRKGKEWDPRHQATTVSLFFNGTQPYLFQFICFTFAVTAKWWFLHHPNQFLTPFIGCIPSAHGVVVVGEREKIELNLPYLIIFSQLHQNRHHP